MGFDASELIALSADLGRASFKVTQGAQTVLRATALSVERTAKQRAPVDTGNLRNSISTSISAGGMTAEIGPTASYGVYVEYGTRRMSPQPYMGPALEANAPMFEKAIGDLMDGLL